MRHAPASIAKGGADVPPFYCLSQTRSSKLAREHMPKTKLRVTKKGDRVSIVLASREYERLIEDLEELDSIRAYDAAKKSGEAPIPFEQALQDIERSRK